MDKKNRQPSPQVLARLASITAQATQEMDAFRNAAKSHRMMAAEIKNVFETQLRYFQRYTLNFIKKENKFLIPLNADFGFYAMETHDGRYVCGLANKGSNTMEQLADGFVAFHALKLIESKYREISHKTYKSTTTRISFARDR
ncbi:MAG: hypothetical protein FWF34_01795 [Alphaproteobacteria bacterium]|nr:hypothetical protein [Alphaproteobacteria bacterium]MCL2889967.1 hypothetical protein [Alphaproteobacteria bacterium]